MPPPLLLRCPLIPTRSSYNRPFGGGALTAKRHPAARGPSHSSTRPHTLREVGRAAAPDPTGGGGDLFNTCVLLPPADKRNSVLNTAAASSELQPLDCNSSTSSGSSGGGGVGGGGGSSCNSNSSSSSGGGRGQSSILSLTNNDRELEGRPTRPSSL